MQTKPIRDLVGAVIASMPVGDAKFLVSAVREFGVNVSERHVVRLLRGALGPVELRSYDLVRDGNGRRLNPAVAAAYDALTRRDRTIVYFGQLVQLKGKPLLLLTNRRGSLIWARPVRPGPDLWSL